MAHRCTPVTAPVLRCYAGPVSENENPAAHGNIVEIARCRCGKVRRTNINGRHLESSGWVDKSRTD